MKNIKLWIIDMPENFINIEEAKIWLKSIYDNMSSSSTVWLGFDYHYYKQVLNLVKEIGFINHLDNWMISENNDSSRKDYFHLTKSTTGYTWNKVEFKREVVVPYKVDGEPRGWFSDTDGRPVRFTGIGNCIYSSKIKEKYNFIDLVFILSSSNKGDFIDIQNIDSYLLARACNRYIYNNDKINKLLPDENLKTNIKEIVGDII